jgi:hypothetical protein
MIAHGRVCEQPFGLSDQGAETSGMPTLSASKHADRRDAGRIVAS